MIGGLDQPIASMEPAMTSIRALVPLVILVPLAACALSQQPPASTPTAPSPVRGAGRLTPKEIADSVLGTMDRTADPCQDFYRYACGTWLDTTKLPPDRPRWGRGFTEIAERNIEILREILEEAGRDPEGNPDRARIGSFYAACMDASTVESRGLEPLRSMLAEIARVVDVQTLMAVAGAMHQVEVRVLFMPDFDADFKDPNINIAHFLQGGLGLPDRDYYLKDEERSRDLRAQYQAHVGRMLVLLGEPPEDAARHAEQIVRFETQLAEVSLPRAETRDPERIYHKIDLAGLKETAPELPWDTFLTATGYPSVTSINVSVPAFFAGMARSAAQASPEVLQAYLRWHLLHATANQLPQAFVDENFAFFGKTLSGQKEIQPRFKRCVAATDGALGEILGRAFVERQFAGESKEIALGMIQGIEASFEGSLPGLAWMDEATRGRAAEKRKAIANKIGYPDAWRDYSSLAVRPGDYFGNTLAARAFEFRRKADQVGKPVDRREWGMTPPTVNAYYNPLLNEMVFPAGIMQRPFFHRDFPPAMNFGGIGMGMGHELTHGFDDQGRKFDGTGKLREWWEPAVIAKFEERARCIEDLYATYEIEPGLSVNGKLTLGENIADLGGVKAAYRAYKAWSRREGETPPVVEGITSDQLFFVAYAQTWCSLQTPEIERVLATVDPHSPPRFRVQGALSNLPEFAQAFQCQAGSPMNPAKKCEVW